jgi:cold shock CspA family protein
MRSGTVDRWDLFGADGWVSPDDVGDPAVHVHFTALQGFGESLPHLAFGERVQYDAKPGRPSREGEPRDQAVRVCPMPGRHHGKVRDYDFQLGHGILEADDSALYFLHHQNMLGQGMKDADPGDEVTFVAGEGSPGGGGLPPALEVKLGDPRMPLYRFAQFPRGAADWLDPLAGKAADESWDYQYERKGEGGHLPVLRHYVEQTFKWLDEERSQQDRETIIEATRPNGQRVAVFNTGLVSPKEDPIYALFSESRQPERAPWTWRGFYVGSERELSDIQAPLPPPADYLGDPERLIIQPGEITAMRVDYEHIVDHNLDRFPGLLKGDADLAERLLRSDIARLPERVRRNYKAAVPQGYRGEIQMLLPLDLLPPKGTPDLALVVQRRDGLCRANTVVGVDGAYRQARLIARPDPEWLGRAWRDQAPT